MRNFGFNKAMEGMDQETNYFKFLALALLFLLLAFDQNMAMIYLLIMICDYIWYQSDNFLSFPVSRPSSNNVQMYIEAVAALGLFLVISTFIVSTFSPQSLIGTGIVGSAQSIFHLLATSTPILHGSKFLTILGWGVFIPIIETRFFNGRLLEGFATYAEVITGKPVRLDTYGLPLIAVIFVVATAFTLFHITAKGLSSIPLLITFIFSVMSSVLVLRHRETKGAIVMHILLNCAAVLAAFGVL